MPALKLLQVQKYDLKTTNAQRINAESTFRILHGMSWGLNLVVFISTGVYLINLVNQHGENSQKLIIKEKIMY